MRRGITRRDFLNGVALSVGGVLLSPHEAFGLRFDDAARGTAPYPPALTGLRGSHEGSFEVAHAVRDGSFWKTVAPAAANGETYDLVVVGAGISGLASAWYFRKAAGPAARFKERWALIREVAREAKRPTDSMESALHLMVNINDDQRAAFEEAVKFLHTYYSPAMSREYIEGWLAYGPPAAVVEKIRAYVDAGCTTPILRFASWDQKGQLARALADVMPAALALRLPD